MDRNWLTHNLGLKLGSLAVALLLWFHTATERDYELVRSIPFEVVGVAADLVVAREVPESLEVRFRGRGKRLLTLRWRDVRVQRDASGVERRARYNLGVENVVAPEGLGLEIVEVLPPTGVTIVLDEKITRRVPVRPQARISPAAGFTTVGTLRAMPDSVTLTGPRTALQAITAVETDTLFVNRARALVEAETALILPAVYNCRCESETVRILQDVQEIGQRTFADIPITFTGTTRPERYVTEPRRITVTVKGGVGVLAEMVASDITLTVDLNTHSPDRMVAVEPLVELPEGITLLRLEPAAVRVTEY